VINVLSKKFVHMNRKGGVNRHNHATEAALADIIKTVIEKQNKELLP